LGFSAVDDAGRADPELTGVAGDPPARVALVGQSVTVFVEAVTALGGRCTRQGRADETAIGTTESAPRPAARADPHGAWGPRALRFVDYAVAVVVEVIAGLHLGLDLRPANEDAHIAH